MQENINGIHHVTAIASDPQRNLDFYTKVLGLRLVKLTVNFDAPDTYHFYLADEVGHPGTILTFFPWPNARRGIRGTGQASALAFSIPPDALGYWIDRLNSHGVAPSIPFQRFDQPGISFQDPDGLEVELIAQEAGINTGVTSWIGSPVPAEMSLRGFHSVSLVEDSFNATSKLMADTFGFHQTHQSEDRVRFEAPSTQPGRVIDLVRLPETTFGRMGAGMIHHVAWRTPNDAEQLTWRDTLIRLGLDVTRVIDRQYFHSIYFHEPGGVLFEIATEPPGFMIDENVDCLGTSLKLPRWMEPRRGDIIAQLPVLQLPVACPEPV